MTLHHTEVGSGSRRVVFLHGLFGQGKNFGAVAKALVTRHPDLRCALVDLPNHGNSPWTERIDYQDMADEVAGFIRDWAGGEPVALVGHSMGGRTAMQVALRHPELVERLVVADVSPVAGHSEDGQFAELIAGLRTLDLTALESRAEADRLASGPIPHPTVRRFLLTNLRHGEEGWRWAVNLDLVEAQLAQVGSWPDPGPVSYPGKVLWIAGQQSDYVRPESEPAMRAYFPATRLVTIKNAGHWVHSQQPEVFTGLVEAFLSA
ncbi:alpha/beta fold hydrolase [Propionibacteriaceae bacterium Y1923]